MWLINTTSLELEDFIGEPPQYAILSHKWGSNKEEVSFREWHEDHNKIMTRPGYIKIAKACEQARKSCLRYLWVDTNCIDKTSSAELSEAINSMFHYYSKAQVCYTYLHDVTNVELDPYDPLSIDSEFGKSSWFTRGWTLQELLAPTNLVFYNAAWLELGTKLQLKNLISQITGIHEYYLTAGIIAIRDASISCRMSWISNRITTRLEDIAYCMLGIFNINMSLLYGERGRAFERLQEELISASNDQTIFAWDRLPENLETFGRRSPRLRGAYLIQLGWKVTDPNMVAGFGTGRTSMLAPDPVLFYNSAEFHNLNPDDTKMRATMPYTITHLGLSIALPFHRSKYEEYQTFHSIALIASSQREDLINRKPDSLIRCLGFAVLESGLDDAKCRRSVHSAAAGSLLSIEIRSSLLCTYFPLTDKFVTNATYYRLETVEASVNLGVWCLEEHNGPTFECVGAIRVGDIGNMVSIFSVSWEGKRVFLLVRALRNPENDLDVLWDCRETEMVSQRYAASKAKIAFKGMGLSEEKVLNLGEYKAKWAFKGMQLSEDEILNLDKTIWLRSMRKQISSFAWVLPKRKLRICLEGEVKFVSNPRACIRFLHATPLTAA